MKRRSAFVAFSLLAALAMAGCGSTPSASDCDKLVRHIIDLEAAEAGAGAVPADQKAELEERKKSVFQAVGTAYCRDEMSVSQVECGLAAKNLTELSSKCEKS